MERRGRLAQRRRTVGCSQEQLAERLGIDRSTVARWEAGDTEPLPWLRPRLARVLQVSLDQLEALLGEAALPVTDDDRLAYVMRRPGSVDLASVLRLRDALEGLGRRYDTEPSTALLADAGTCLSTITLFREHARGSRLNRELLALEADAAIVLGNLALARLQQHDLGGAVTAMHETIDVLERTWGGGGLSLVFSAARQMKPWAHTPAVSDVQERLFSLIATH